MNHQEDRALVEKFTKEARDEFLAPPASSPRGEAAPSGSPAPIMTGKAAALTKGFAAGIIGQALEGLSQLATSIYFAGIPEEQLWDDPRYLDMLVAQEEFAEFSEQMLYLALEEDELLGTTGAALGTFVPEVLSPGSKAKAGAAGLAATTMGAKYLAVQAKILKLVKASRERAVNILKIRPRDFVYGANKWWGAHIQSYALLKESMQWTSTHQHHLLPKAILKYGPRNTKGLQDYIPTVTLEGSEHLDTLHKELNQYLVDEVGDLKELWKRPELTTQKVLAAIERTKEFYRERNLDHFAEAIDEFSQKAYNRVK